MITDNTIRKELQREGSKCKFNIGLIKITSIIMPVIFLFCSCMSNFDENTPFVAPNETDEADAVSEFIIVISDGASAELINRALCLSEEINKRTSVDCRVLRDSESYIPLEGGVEIVLGNTMRQVSVKALYGMRAEDYICKTVDGSVVIGGKSDGATVVAVDRFCSEILPVSTRFSLIPENGGFSYSASYKTNSIRLNGLPLGEYKILVYDADDRAVVDIAKAMQTRVANETGYWLEIWEHHGGAFGTGTIFLGDISEDYEGDSAYITVRDSSFFFEASYTEAIRSCAEYFCSFLRDKAVGGDVVCQLTSTVKLELPTSSCYILSSDIHGYLPIESPSSVSELLTFAMDGDYDLALFGVMSEGDERRISENMEGYSKVAAECEDDNAYAYSRTECEYIFVGESDGLLTEVTRINKGALEFLLVRISGRADSGVSIDLDGLIGSLELPVAVVTHTYGGSVTVLSEIRNLYKASEREVDRSNGEIARFSCYGETDRLLVRFAETDSEANFCGVKVETVK